MTAIAVRCAPLEGSGPLEERLAVHTSLGLAWEEALSDFTLSFRSACCFSELEEGEKYFSCSTCGEPTRWRRGTRVERVKFSQRGLYSWLELWTDPLSPLVLTPPLFEHLKALQAELVRRSSPRPRVLLWERECWEELAALCDKYSTTV